MVPTSAKIKMTALLLSGVFAAVLFISAPVFLYGYVVRVQYERKRALLFWGGELEADAYRAFGFMPKEKEGIAP